MSAGDRVAQGSSLIIDNRPTQTQCCLVSEQIDVVGTFDFKAQADLKQTPKQVGQMTVMH